jgi:hypothetical protein
MIFRFSTQYTLDELPEENHPDARSDGREPHNAQVTLTQFHLYLETSKYLGGVNYGRQSLGLDPFDDTHVVRSHVVAT